MFKWPVNAMISESIKARQIGFQIEIAWFLIMRKFVIRM